MSYDQQRKQFMWDKSAIESKISIKYKATINTVFDRKFRISFKELLNCGFGGKLTVIISTTGFDEITYIWNNSISLCTWTFVVAIFKIEMNIVVTLCCVYLCLCGGVFVYVDVRALYALANVCISKWTVWKLVFFLTITVQWKRVAFYNRSFIHSRG